MVGFDLQRRGPGMYGLPSASGSDLNGYTRHTRADGTTLRAVGVSTPIEV